MSSPQPEDDAALDRERKGLEIAKLQQELRVLRHPYSTPSFWFGTVTAILAVMGVVAQGILSSIKSERADLKIEQAATRLKEAEDQLGLVTGQRDALQGERDALEKEIVDLRSRRETARRDLDLIIRHTQERSGDARTSQFNIEIRFLGGLSPSQHKLFLDVAARWQQIIVGDLPPETVDGEQIDDVLILAEGTAIDGEGSIQGQAGPTHLRPTTAGRAALLPIRGLMVFDVADLVKGEKDGSLRSVIFEEMGHVLGFGTIWEEKKLVQDVRTANPVFVGRNARREYEVRLAGGAGRMVPLENVGGLGVVGGHWRESVFGPESMTVTTKPGTKIVSRVTIGAIEDLGYVVNYEAAEPYKLPARVPETK